MKSLELLGLDTLWRISLEAKTLGVANSAGDMLLAMTENVISTKFLP